MEKNSKIPRKGESGGKNKQSSRSTPKKKKKIGKVGTVLLTTLMVCIIAGSILASVMAVYIFKYVKEEPNIDLDALPFNYTTILYADDKATGEPVEIERIHESENRIWVDMENIPKDVRNVAIAAEDKRFESHHGVDWRRTIYSTFRYLLRQSQQGGSTITQQLIKNVTNEKDVSITRKVKEIFSALKLEKSYTKEQILEAYLNTIAVANNTNGIEAAANLYFNKKTPDLTIPEACTIIAITQNPAYYNPLTEEGLAHNKVRCGYILSEMQKLGMITAEQKTEYENTEIVIANKRDNSSEKKNTNIQSWFVDHVVFEVIGDLQEKYNLSYDEARSRLFNDGYRVYTTMDIDIQNSMEDTYNNPNNFPAMKSGEYPETAAIVMSKEGRLLGIIGGNEKNTNYGFNRATMAERQPGSSIKPISAYLQAFETDMLTWSTIVKDEPLRKDDKGNPWPHNYYETYLGRMTVMDALRRSTNTIPVQIITQIGPQQSYNFLENKLGFTTLVEGRDNTSVASMAIGAMEHGATPLEMLGAYQIHYNGGKYVEPYAYTKVLDSQGNLILEKDTTQVRVISEETSTIINKLMQKVVDSAPGSGTGANMGAMPVAGKTGTSDENQNLWFIGGTPYYLGCVWMGYDTPAWVNYGYYPTPIIWKNIMTPIHRNLPVKAFDAASTVVSREYCTSTGKLAGDDCDSREIGWYKLSNLPEVCDGVHPVEDDDDYRDEDEDDRDSNAGQDRNNGKRPSSSEDEAA